jgi:peptidoglycan/LPS O-acetylase OafA/YrhL
MSAKERPNYLLFASWRLFAAILVMIYHYSNYGPEPFQAINGKMQRLTPMLDMFFIISGFLIWTHYSGRVSGWGNFKSFIIRRLARLYPLHLLTLSFFCVVGLAIHFGFVGTGAPERYALSELVKELLLVNAWGTTDVLAFNYVSWSISAEWFSYLLFPLLVYVYSHYGIKGLLIQLVLTIAALEGSTAIGLMPFPTWLDANTWGAYRVFADFTLGAVLADCVRRYPIPIRNHILPWATFGLAMVVMLSGISSGYLAIAIITVSLYLAARVEMTAPRSSAYLKPFLPFASVSFGIYLWHPVMGIVVISLVWKRILGGTDALSFGIAMIAAMLLSIVIALISARFFENPMRKWILDRARATSPQKSANAQSGKDAVPVQGQVAAE